MSLHCRITYLQVPRIRRGTYLEAIVLPTKEGKQRKWVGSCVLVPQFSPTLCNTMDCSLPGSSVHGILWSRLLFPTPGDLLDLGIKPKSPSLQADSLPSEPPGKI